MKKRIIFSAISGVIFAAILLLEMGCMSVKPAAPDKPSAESIPGITEDPDTDLFVPPRKTAINSTEPPTNKSEAEFVHLAYPIIVIKDGQTTIIEPGYYRIFKQNNRLEEF